MGKPWENGKIIGNPWEKDGKMVIDPSVELYITLQDHHFEMGKLTISMANFNSYVAKRVGFPEPTEIPYPI